MNVLIAALAEHASIAQPGDRLNINGVFDSAYAVAFPTQLSAVVALRLQCEYEDRGAHQVEFSIVNQDGREFGKLVTPLTIHEVPPGERHIVNHLTFLQSLVFAAPGRVSIVIRWDSDEKQRLPLDVLQAPTAPPAPPPA